MTVSFTAKSKLLIKSSLKLKVLQINALCRMQIGQLEKILDLISFISRFELEDLTMEHRN